jgi:translation elongation factor EF-1alpha
LSLDTSLIDLDLDLAGEKMSSQLVGIVTQPQVVRFAVGSHRDAGKSSLCGHLQVLAGKVTAHELEKLADLALTNKHKGAEFAYLGDCDDDERERGITTESSSSEFTYENTKYLLSDNPGHKLFIRSLLEGFHQYPPHLTIGCLLVSLITGEYEAGMNGGQTKENATLMRGVGMDHLVVVMNKIDVVPVGSERYNQIYKEVSAFVNRLGFKTVTICPMSTYQGTGLTDLLHILRHITETHISGQPANKPVSEMAIASVRNEFPMIQTRMFLSDDFNGLITVGFQCILHCGLHEYPVVFEKFRHYDVKTKAISNKSKIIRNGEVVIIKLSSEVPFYADSMSLTDRVILRKDDFTIGYGKLWFKQN